MLELENVNAFYGRIQALHDVSLGVEEGQVVSLLGANGAGKTTTLRTIMGLHGASNGAIRFHGQPLNRVAPHKIVALGIAMVPERRELFPDMSVRDNLEMGAYSRADHGIQRDMEWVCGLFPALAERRRQHAKTLSGGQQQMLAVGRALMSRPKILLLDEPTLGLSPLLVAQTFGTFKELNRQGLTILLIEQNAVQALAMSDYGYILENGRIVLQGTSASLRENPLVKDSYLGGV